MKDVAGREGRGGRGGRGRGTCMGEHEGRGDAAHVSDET